MGLKVMHPWSYLAWLTDGSLVLAKSSSLYWNVGLNRFRGSYPNQSSRRQAQLHCQLYNLFPNDLRGRGSALPKLSNYSSVSLSLSTLSAYCPVQPGYGEQIISSLFPQALVSVLWQISFQLSNNVWEEISIMFICLTRPMTTLHLHRSWNWMWSSAWRKRCTLSYSSFCWGFLSKW